MIVCHDCDITNVNLEAEPHVEIICLEPIDEEDGRLLWE